MEKGGINIFFIMSSSCRMPHNIVYDRGATFTSLFWKELFKLQGVTLSYSFAYHPQSDEQTEVVNKCLEHFMRGFTGDKT
ncbi:hypothetical protein CIPAW_14G066800 [Carya illinoinensis]|uniref:Integrase catalytic domain-containing protein n=1 Tax=Carya illinoinensis TaxID=32201 RepID=A0A8T1NJW8_CARIL|nr:hypothetical protein CIPAW_14G066800 [Carya illinoinensis]